MGRGRLACGRMAVGAEDGGRFDGFEADGLDRWSVLEMPIGDGDVHRHEDPDATVRVVGEVAEVDIPRFSLAFDGIHMLDDPKQMFVFGETLPVATEGTTRFGAEVAAESYGGCADDPRDGLATFNVVDLTSGMVFDVAASATHVWAIRERLPVPGVAAEEGFTYLAESPFAQLAQDADAFHRCAIEFDPGRREVRWLVDDERIYHAAGVEPFPTAVTIAFGIATLHPQPEGVSISIRGQGMRARWRRFTRREEGR
jgi:hypothetical protein